MSLSTTLARNDRGFKLLVSGLSVVTVITMMIAMLVTSRHQQSMWHRWLPFETASAGQGEQVFRDKGCVHCHAIGGFGGSSAPDLARTGTEQASLPQLVTAMWNHAPRMWKQMETEKLSRPGFTYDETAQLLAFLYRSRHLDEPGDAQHGRTLFEAKHCARCHSVPAEDLISAAPGMRAAGVLKSKAGGVGEPVGSSGRKATPELSVIRSLGKTGWMQAMLTHASAMQIRMAQLGMAWPELSGGELNDLISYLQEASGGVQFGAPTRSRAAVARTGAEAPGDPDNGWQVYQSKSCLVCHSVRQDGGFGPSLGPSTQLPASRSGIAALMWNAFPKMKQAIEQRNLSQFEFKEHELADLISFVQSLRYFEPTGSPQLGQSVFVARGCGHCHGNHGQGGAAAPPLRKPGEIYNSVSLATALWNHGGKMYQEAQRSGLDWPTVEESDVGDLLAFLNQTPGKARE